MKIDQVECFLKDSKGFDYFVMKGLFVIQFVIIMKSCDKS